MINLQLTSKEFLELYGELCRMRALACNISKRDVYKANWWNDRYSYTSHIIRNLEAIAEAQGLDLQEVINDGC